MNLIVGNSITKVEASRADMATLWGVLTYVDRFYAGHGWKKTTKSMFNRKTKQFYTGLLPMAINGLSSLGVTFKLQDVRYKSKDSNWPVTLNGYTLRDYQLEAGEAFLQAKRGIIQAGTGAGKTVTAAAIIKACATNTIFLVHRTHLLYQTAETFVDAMPEIKPYIGIVGDGSKDFRPITMATVQSLDSMLKKYGERVEKELAQFNLMIVDEAHRATSAQFGKIITRLSNCDYRLGLTATPFMSGKEYDDLALKGLFGNVVFKITASELIRRGVLARPYFKFYPVTSPNNAKIKKLKNYRDIYEQLIIHNEARNKLVAVKTRELVAMGKKTLVICSEINHIKNLEPMLRSQGLNVAVATGSNTTRSRKSILSDLDSGGNDCIICSTIFDEGVDLPNIAGLVNAAGQKSAPAILQRTGRTIRKKEKDNYAVIVDFHDKTHKILEKQSEARMDIVRSEPEFRFLP